MKLINKLKEKNIKTEEETKKHVALSETEISDEDLDHVPDGIMQVQPESILDQKK